MNDWKNNLPNAVTPQRMAVLENAINTVRRASSAPKLEGEDLSETVEAWQRVLVAVPTDELLSLAIRAQREKGSSFPVAASEVFDLWDRPQRAVASSQASHLSQTWHVQMGMCTEEEESQRIRAFQEAERRRRAASVRVNTLIDNLSCDCEQPAVLSKDHRLYVCAMNRCGFAFINSEQISEAIKDAKREGMGKLIEVPDSTWNQMPEAKLPELPRRDVALENSYAAPVSDAEIIAALRDAVRLDVDALGYDDSLSFGRYVVAQIGVAGLNERDALSLWDEWRVLEPEAVAPPVHSVVGVA